MFVLKSKYKALQESHANTISMFNNLTNDYKLLKDKYNNVLSEGIKLASERNEAINQSRKFAQKLETVKNSPKYVKEMNECFKDFNETFKLITFEPYNNKSMSCSTKKSKPKSKPKKK